MFPLFARFHPEEAPERVPPVGHPLVRLGVVLFVATGLLSLGAGLVTFYRYDRLAAGYDIRLVSEIPMASEVLDAAGEHLTYLHGDLVGDPVLLEDISPSFLNALVAREDARFYDHHGIDTRGLVRAWVRNLREKRAVQGASTITMQLARISFGLSSRTVERKLLEMALARRIDQEFTKEEIITLYSNRVFLGTGMNGVEQAAQGYFGKPAADLSVPEAAMIAGVLRAPNGFSPFRNYDAALREMRSTLDRMVEEKYLDPTAAAAYAKERPKVLDQKRWMARLREQSKISGGSWVQQLVDEEVAELLPSYAGVGGLIIHTTLDPRLQAAAEQAIAAGLLEAESLASYPHPTYAQYAGGSPEYLQAATLVLENDSGAIRALVGGRDYEHSAFNRATSARRPLGSAFKPFVYGTAFERGLFPGVMISDDQIAPGEIAWHDDDWSPYNADGTYGGLLPAAVGLIRSRNTMTVRVGEWAGIDHVLRMMDYAGLAPATGAPRNPTVYLGTVESTVKDLTSAYSAFATGGIRWRPHLIESITDRRGTEVYRNTPANYQVFSPGAAWLTSSLLQQVIEEGGTASSLRKGGFQAPAGGKTGTTSEFRDAWFAGYTSRLTASVWLGFDRPAKIGEGAYGGRIALPIWQEIMSAAAGFGYEFGDLPTAELVPMELSRTSGLLPNDVDRAAGDVYMEDVPSDLIPQEAGM
jgi:penicillin-binding protein 1A